MTSSPLGAGVHRLGGAIAVDGRVSWFPSTVRGEAPVNCYLILGESDAVLVDTGLPVLEDEVVAGLRELLGHRRLSVFPTRPVEFDSIGNIGAILGAGGSRVWSDMPMEGLAGWQARYELPPLGIDASWPLDAGVEFLPFPAEVEVGGRRLEVIRPELRMLMTAWLYDPFSGTLFTSDMFSHVLASASGSWLLDRPDGTRSRRSRHTTRRNTTGWRRPTVRSWRRGSRCSSPSVASGRSHRRSAASSAVAKR